MASVHIYCPRPSQSAINLRDGLIAAGVPTTKTKPVGRDQRLVQRSLNRFCGKIRPTDIVIAWGTYPPLEYILSGVGAKFLNCSGSVAGNKRDELIVLASNGIPVPEVYDYPAPNSLGRSFRHQGGRDLLRENGQDFWTQKLPFVREVRVHVFKGRSIHTGLKVPRIDNPHPWIRSYDAGWKIDYSHAHTIKSSRRDLAKQAIAALGLDFGAVDIGIVRGGVAYVLEVNSAPGLDIGPSTDVYVREILRELNS